jgi:hypothetical protein
MVYNLGSILKAQSGIKMDQYVDAGGQFTFGVFANDSIVRNFPPPAPPKTATNFLT